MFEAFGDGKLTVYQWNDNQPVCVIINHEGASLKTSVQRWSLTTKNEVSITQPRMIASYNKHRRGTDLLDCFLSKTGHDFFASLTLPVAS